MGSNFENTTLDDEAATPIGNGFAPFAGSYKPEGHLSDFDGLDAQGLWELRVVDDETSISGTLISWRLFIDGNGNGEPPPEPNNPNPPDGAVDVPVNIFLSWNGNSSSSLWLSSKPVSPMDSLAEERTRLDLEKNLANPIKPEALRSEYMPFAEGENVDTVGSDQSYFDGYINDGVGNFYYVATRVTLTQIETYLGITNSTRLRFFVYESSSEFGTYYKIFDYEVSDSETGTRWYSLGSIDVVLDAGKFYFIGVSYIDNTTYYYDVSAPNPVSFGTQIDGGHTGYPPPETKNRSNVVYSLAYYQRLTTTDDTQPPPTTYDLYLGTDRDALELIASDLDQSTLQSASPCVRNTETIFLASYSQKRQW